MPDEMEVHSTMVNDDKSLHLQEEPETLSNDTTTSTKSHQHRKRRYHWGYMVVFGCFLLHVLLGGFNRCYGVIYLQLQERFNSSAAITAGVGGLSTALRMLGGQ